MRIQNLLVLMVLTLHGFAQESSDQLREADDLFNQKRYGAALPFYLEYIKTTQGNGATYYNAGICYLHSRSQKNKAIKFLEKAIALSTFNPKTEPKASDAPIFVFSYLGNAYHNNYQFDEAIFNYEKYKSLLKESALKDPVAHKEIDARIATSKFAKEFKKTAGLPSNIKFDHFKGGNDSAIGDFSSALSPDKTMMIYTFKVPVDKLATFEDEKYFEVIPGLKTDKQDSLPPQKSLRKKGQQNQDTVVNITTVGTSVDGHVVLTYRDDKSEGNLYISRLRENTWSAPVKLPKTFNDKGWEPKEFLTSDGNTLYFVSNRRGGYGGNDIYQCKRLPDGEWSKAVNMGPEINTAFDDEAPFLHTDGVTLFFSSNRFKPTLSFDVFTSTKSGENWGKPVLVGYPINSSAENSFYQVSADKKKQGPSKTAVPDNKEDQSKDKKGKEPKILSRKDSIKLKEKTPKDIYIISFESQNKSNLTLIKGEVTTPEGNSPIGAEITLTDNLTGRVLSTYYSNKNTGVYSFIIPIGKSIGITYTAPGYLFQTGHQNIKSDKNYFEPHELTRMPVLEKGAKTKLNNIFFDDDKSEVKPTSITELNRVFDLLVENPGMKIKVCNYIYTQDKSYIFLSEQRAMSVVNYLIEKGINKNRLEGKGIWNAKAPVLKDKKDVVLKDPPKLIQYLELEINEIRN